MRLVLLLLVISLLFPIPGKSAVSAADNILCQSSKWMVDREDDEVRIFYKRGARLSQYGVVHTTSSYFRLVYGPSSGWGTSIVLLPSFWSGGVYYQGAPVKVTCRIVNPNLVLTLRGTIHSLTVTVRVVISPPTASSITAQVRATVSGSVSLDTRPGEAFKPVMLSSMHISKTVWDTSRACTDTKCYTIPPSGWIIPPRPVVKSLSFRLVGGTSTWKTNAPTVKITFPVRRQIAGWVTPSSDPNDDNVALWAAANTVLAAWNYTILVSRPN